MSKCQLHCQLQFTSAIIYAGEDGEMGQLSPPHPKKCGRSPFKAEYSLLFDVLSYCLYNRNWIQETKIQRWKPEILCNRFFQCTLTSQAPRVYAPVKQVVTLRSWRRVAYFRQIGWPRLCTCFSPPDSMYCIWINRDKMRWDETRCSQVVKIYRTTVWCLSYCNWTAQYIFYYEYNLCALKHQQIQLIFRQ